MRFAAGAEFGTKATTGTRACWGRRDKGLFGQAGFSSGDGGRKLAHGEAMRRFNLNYLVQHEIRVIAFEQMPQHRLNPLPLLLS